MKNHHLLRMFLTTASLIMVTYAMAYPVGTGFTYQGKLTEADGSPSNGLFDFQFQLFDDLTAGGQVGPTVTIEDQSVSGGLFTVKLDFGAGIFEGSARWLAIAVRPGDSAGAYTQLSSRQEVMAVPQAQLALKTMGVDGHSLDAADGSPTDKVYVYNDGKIRLGGPLGGTGRTVNIGGGLNLYDDDGTGISQGISLTSNNFDFRELTGETAVWQYNHTQDTHRFFTGDETLRLIITSGGNIGIGIPTPSDKLSVSGIVQSTSGGFKFPDGTIQTSAAATSWWSSNGNHIYNNNTGNVGIGTTTPQAPFHITNTLSTSVLMENTAASGNTVTVRARNTSTSGAALRASASASSGTNYGLDAYAASPDGYAVYAFNEAESGNGYAIFGETASPSGFAVYGSAGSSTGTGVHGSSGSGTRGELGNPTAGASGLATGVSGTNYGGYFQSASTGGYGVYGETTAVTGANFGGYFKNASTSGYGVFGIATAATGGTYGGRFENASTSGRGVFAWATATTGAAYGVQGRSDSSSGAGIYGTALSSTGTTYGVYGWSSSSSGNGVYGEAGAISGTTYGVHGVNRSTSGRGVFGEATTTSGETYGGYFQSASASGQGVYGLSTRLTGAGYGVHGRSEGIDGRGVYGEATGGNGTAVYGEATATSLTSSGSTYGVYGRSDAGSVFGNTGSGYGVYGEATATSGRGYGLYGKSASTGGDGIVGISTATTGETSGGRFVSASNEGYGVFGEASEDIGQTYGGYFVSHGNTGRGIYAACLGGNNDSFGVAGFALAPSGWGVYSHGNFGASGSKAFRIDHPTDPTNKYLLHYSAEGPEPLNIYSGTVVTDNNGEAWVDLPHYFQSINRDFRYILTVVEDNDSEVFVQAKVAKKIAGNRFKIRTNAPNVEVCWEVKGVRNDLFMQNRGAPVEVEKSAKERGKYQHPELYGQRAEMGINYPQVRAQQ